jgi:curved DNA-binding protein
MKYKDYYAILGVARDAGEADIKKAYRKLARKYHPDVSKEPAAEERFKDVGEAYETLRDKEKRAAYDALGRHRPGQDFRPPPDWAQHFRGGGGEDFGGIDLSDLFASLGGGFGRARGFGGRNMPIPGEDFEVTVHLDLTEAARGTEVTLELAMREITPEGRILRTPRSVRARIPKGVTDGQKLRLRGKGGPGANGGPAGDLYLSIALHPHPLFRASGHDLYLEVPVTPWEAALGAQIEIPTLEGRLSLKIPAGSKAGQKLRVAGQGLPQPHGGAGDLYAVLSIAVPGTLSAREKELFEQLRAASGFDPRGHFAG